MSVEAAIRQAVMGIADPDERQAVADRLTIYCRGQAPKSAGEMTALVERAIQALRGA
jgi:hypothetical protein